MDDEHIIDDRDKKANIAYRVSKTSFGDKIDKKAGKHSQYMLNKPSDIQVMSKDKIDHRKKVGVEWTIVVRCGVTGQM